MWNVFSNLNIYTWIMRSQPSLPMVVTFGASWNLPSWLSKNPFIFTRNCPNVLQQLSLWAMFCFCQIFKQNTLANSCIVWWQLWTGARFCYTCCFFWVNISFDWSYSSPCLPCVVGNLIFTSCYLWSSMECKKTDHIQLQCWSLLKLHACVSWVHGNSTTYPRHPSDIHTNNTAWRETF